MKNSADDNLTVKEIKTFLDKILRREIKQLIQDIEKKLDQLLTRSDIQAFSKSIKEVHVLLQKYIRMLQYHNEEIIDIKQRLEILERAQKKLN